MRRAPIVVYGGWAVAALLLGVTLLTLAQSPVGGKEGIGQTQEVGAAGDAGSGQQVGNLPMPTEAPSSEDVHPINQALELPQSGQSTGPLPDKEPSTPPSSEAGAGSDISKTERGLTANPELSTPALAQASAFMQIAGSALHPRNSSTDWAYGGGGCIYALDASSQDMFSVHLQIPAGSRIDGLTYFYIDQNRTEKSEAWLSTYTISGQSNDIAYAASVDNASSSFGVTQSNFVTHTVNYETNAYVLNWRPNLAGPTMQLCSLRVAYTPSTQLYLPAVQK